MRANQPFMEYFKMKSRHLRPKGLGRPWENLVHDSPNIIIHSSVLYFFYCCQQSSAVEYKPFCLISFFLSYGFWSHHLLLGRPIFLCHFECLHTPNFCMSVSLIPLKHNVHLLLKSTMISF